jgi:hypothetical protein
MPKYQFELPDCLTSDEILQIRAGVRTSFQIEELPKSGRTAGATIWFKDGPQQFASRACMQTHHDGVIKFIGWERV